MTTAQKVLLATATFIETYGLSEGGTQDTHGRVCTVVAVGLVTQDFDEKEKEKALGLIRDRLGRGVGIGEWSDNADPDEVVATLRSIAGTTAHEGTLVA